MKPSTVITLVGCGLLAALTADVQAQLLTKIKFSTLEGYTDGALEGQPAGTGTNVWYLPSSMNKGRWLIITNETPTETNLYQWIVQTVTNGAMIVASDGNLGIDMDPESAKYGQTPDSLQYFAIHFPPQRKGPVTVTWDWKFYSTNVLLNAIPEDYDPTNNNYTTTLQGYDIGFTLADSANRLMDGNTNAVFNELSTPTRLGQLADSRFNSAYGACQGSGSWNDYGPQFKDGKTLHMKMVAYFGHPEDPFNDSYDVWAQREDEDIWHTTVCAKPACLDTGDPTTDFTNGPFPMRRCPGEYDSDPKLDCITLWMNNGNDKFGAYMVVDNIRVVGPDPVPPPTLRIDRVDGEQVKLTFTGWLQAADRPEGPYTDVALPASSPWTIPASDAAKFYRAEN